MISEAQPFTTVCSTMIIVVRRRVGVKVGASRIGKPRVQVQVLSL